MKPGNGVITKERSIYCVFLTPSEILIIFENIVANKL